MPRRSVPAAELEHAALELAPGLDEFAAELAAGLAAGRLDAAGAARLIVGYERRTLTAATG